MIGARFGIGRGNLERRGLVRVGTGRLWRLPRGRDPKASVRKAAAEEREERG